MLQEIKEKNLVIHLNKNSETVLYLVDYRKEEFQLASFGSRNTSRKEDQMFAEIFRDTLINEGCIEIENIFITDTKKKAEVDENNLRTDMMRED